jgi:hypothetical protein
LSVVSHNFFMEIIYQVLIVIAVLCALTPFVRLLKNYFSVKTFVIEETEEEDIENNDVQVFRIEEGNDENSYQDPEDDGVKS